MKYIIFIIFFIISMDSLGQKKWIGIWDGWNNNFCKMYSISSDSFNIQNVETPGYGEWLVCISDSENGIINSRDIIKDRDNKDSSNIHYYLAYIDRCYWTGFDCTGKNDRYLELPDGHWLCYESKKNKKSYCKWEKIIIDNDIEGLARTYDSTKNLKETAEYRKGAKNGCDLIYDNSYIKYIITYNNFSLIEIIELFKDNQIKESRRCNGDKRWNKNGILISYVEIDSNFHYNGAAIEYYDDGTIKNSGTFIYEDTEENSEKNGVWRHYNKIGAISDEATWDKGKLINEKHFLTVDSVR